MEQIDSIDILLLATPLKPGIVRLGYVLLKKFVEKKSWLNTFSVIQPKDTRSGQEMSLVYLHYITRNLLPKNSYPITFHRRHSFFYFYII